MTNLIRFVNYTGMKKQTDKMNKKEELKKLIEEQKEDTGFFSFGMTKQHAFFGTIFSPIFILIILADWIFEFMDYSGGTPAIIFRPLALMIGVILFITSFTTYKSKVKNEKTNKEKIDKLINDLKE